MHKKATRNKTAPNLAETAKRRKSKVKPDNEPGANKTYITLIENGCSFKIPVSGPKGNWLWDKIDNNLLRKIIKARINERGITSRTEFSKSNPCGARLIKRAKDLGILDDILPAKTNPITKRRKKTKDSDVGKLRPEDHERHAENQRIVTQWMNDSEWWNNFEASRKSSK